MIQLNDPLSAASDAVGAFFASKRQQELQQRAEAFQQQRASRADFQSDRDYALAQQRAADTHATTESNLATAAQSRSIAQAQEDFEQQMRPLRAEYQRIQNKLANGQVADQKDLQTLRKYQITEARVRANVASRYGVPLAALQLQQGEASLDATRAGIGATEANTAATQQRTSQQGQLFPYELQGAQQGVRSGALDYNIKKRTFDSLGPPIDPKLQQDYRARLSTWKQQFDQYQRLSVRDPAKYPMEKAPAEPMSPEDFEATVADSIDALRRDPSKRAAMEQAIDANGALSPYQKRAAHLRIRAALGSTMSGPQSIPYGLELGGSQGAGPFPTSSLGRPPPTAFPSP